MEYFRILNLIHEPFSNSPEPEFFFQSPKHVSCLQKLELAIRLRRGLNVVMGHVGTGKTTLCRHLILHFATGSGEDDQVETHLLMDPAFITPLEFLSAVALSFGIIGKRRKRATPDADLTEWQLKENIKEYLLHKGVDEKKIVVLIIDEGQNLPAFCLEILREFLNFETNENKLLQIVIFAQEEFQEVLDRIENFADRVNLLYMLEPLNFRETRDLIRFRIARASEPGNVPVLFTFSGMRALYRATGGYPRKIITLCHQVVLALIIQNRTKAGWFLVRSCARRLVSAGQPSRAWQLRWVPGILIVILAALTFMIARPVQTSPVRPPEAPRPEAPPPEAPRPEATRPEAPRQETAVRETARYSKPAMLGKLSLKNGRTIWWMLTDFYGEYNKDIFKSVSLANPHIQNLSRVQAGRTIHLPALPVTVSPLPDNQYRVQLVASKNLEETYELYRTYQPTIPGLRFLPYWNPRQGVVFSIFLKEGYPDEMSAKRSVTRLPTALASGARVLKNLDKDTVFYTR